MRNNFSKSVTAPRLRNCERMTTRRFILAQLSSTEKRCQDAREAENTRCLSRNHSVISVVSCFITMDDRCPLSTGRKSSFDVHLGFPAYIGIAPAVNW